jgi:cytochrome c
MSGLIQRSASFGQWMVGALLSVALGACGGPTAPAETASEITPPSPAAAAPPAADPILLEIRDAAGAQLSGNPQAGSRVFRALCASCHAVAPGLNGTGPSLHGIIDRAAGGVEGFRYSEANRASGITWTEQELFDYLERPSARIPGTTMIFQGIAQPQQRADLIAYLRSQSP